MSYLVTVLATCLASAVLVSLGAGLVLGFGIRPRRVVYGLGPPVFDAGLVRVGPILLGGYVEFFDSRAQALPPELLRHAIDRKPPWQHYSILLLPNLIGLAVGAALFGRDAPGMLWEVWSRFVHGALAPLSVARAELASFDAFVASAPVPFTVAWMLMLNAALGLLPVGPAATGQVLVEIVSRRRRPHRVAERLWLGTTLLFFTMLGAWGVAIVAFVWSAA